MAVLPTHHYDGAILIAPKTQDAYFRHYREDHPDESFDVLDLPALEAMFQFDLDPKADKALLSYDVANEDLEVAKTVIRRLRYAPRIDVLSPYFELKDKLEKNGLLRVLSDPFAYFKGKMIIVRGYADGRAISEAMQDLPNICVNFDFGQERPREEETKTVSIGEAVALIKQAEAPVFLLAPTGEKIPEPLLDLPRLDIPYAPSEGFFLVLASDKPYFPLREIPLGDDVLKALRLPSLPEAKRRLDVEMKTLLSSPRLLAVADSRKG